MVVSGFYLPSRTYCSRTIRTLLFRQSSTSAMGARPFVVDGFAMAPERMKQQEGKALEDDAPAAYPLTDQSDERHLITYVDSEPPSRYPNSLNFPDVRFFEAEVVRYAVWMIDALVVFNVVSVLVIIGRNSWRLDNIHTNPLLGPSVAALDQYGLKNTLRIVAKKEWWRLFSSVFLHAGVGDLLYSVLVLLCAGVPLESGYGFRAVILIYLSSGVMAMIVSAVFNPGVYSVGAVAASAGLLGARLGDVTKNGLELRRGSLQFTLALTFGLFGVGLGMGILPLMDNVALIVSFGMGFLAGLALLKLSIKLGPNVQRSNLTLVELLAGICWALLAFSAVLNFNEVRSGRACFYCSLPSWFPQCMETKYWTCSSQFIKG